MERITAKWYTKDDKKTLQNIKIVVKLTGAFKIRFLNERN